MPFEMVNINPPEYCMEDPPGNYEFIHAVWLDRCRGDPLPDNAADATDCYAVCANSVTGDSFAAAYTESSDRCTDSSCISGIVSLADAAEMISRYISTPGTMFDRTAAARGTS